jgi:hypothetical protein
MKRFRTLEGDCQPKPNPSECGLSSAHTATVTRRKVAGIEVAFSLALVF